LKPIETTGLNGHRKHPAHWTKDYNAPKQLFIHLIAPKI